ncbi:MAG: AAA family ATPase [Planctomycetaceae bacterium]|jgi:predicted ATPase|nr:AAA family ATPase [Planctomycetaceae bacterium]
MAINRVEVRDFLVFKGEFTAEFCSGVNVFIGGNGTGKTTLLRLLYKYKNVGISTDNSSGLSEKVCVEIIRKPFNNENCNIILDNRGVKNSVFIPEKDILEHAKGLLTFIEDKQTGFSSIYKDVLVKAQDVPTQKQTEIQKNIGKIISDKISGKVKWDKGDGSFYTIKTNGDRIPFANEASGFKKLGFLGLLVTCGQLESGTILFWDEPENSLNPELVSVLVDILLELSRNGVQVFIATHSELLANYFLVNRKKSDAVMFYSLYKDGEHIKYDYSDRFDLLNPNKLTDEPVKLYEKRLDKVLGDE